MNTTAHEETLRSLMRIEDDHRTTSVHIVVGKDVFEAI
jgi:hypothetical protein